MHAYEVRYELPDAEVRSVYVIATDVVDACRQVEDAYPGSEAIGLSRKGPALAKKEK